MIRTNSVVNTNSVKIGFTPNSNNFGLQIGIMEKIKGTMAIHTMIAIFHFFGIFNSSILSIRNFFISHFNGRL